MEIKDHELTLTRIKKDLFRIEIDGIDILNNIRTVIEGDSIKLRLPIATYKAKVAFINED